MATQVGIGILIGLFIGFTLGIYTAVHYRDRDYVTIVQKATAVFVGAAWIVMHAYLILTGGGTLNIFVDVIGSAAVGELLGINLVQLIKQARGVK